MLASDLLLDFLNRFYGYGSWDAELWFVGMEEGGGNSEEEIAKRLEAWDRADDLADIRDYSYEIGGKWFADRPSIQNTWGKLIRIALAYEGRPTDIEAVRRYQRDELGKRHALIELFPLASPSTSEWLYANIPEIATREKYRALIADTRIATLTNRIAHHKPTAVVFYGTRYRVHWVKISGVTFTKNDAGRFETGHNGSTLFVIAPHPTARGVTNRNFEAIGEWIAESSSHGDKETRILRCRFPFPPQDPLVEMPEPCSSKCPNFDADLARQHATMSETDATLLATIRNFADWFYKPGQSEEMLDEQIRHAAKLYVRRDHTGTCVPKTVLFMHYKLLQYSTYTAPLELSEYARAALQGKDTLSWPDGESAHGLTWNGMFGRYSSRYE